MCCLLGWGGGTRGGLVDSSGSVRSRCSGVSGVGRELLQLFIAPERWPPAPVCPVCRVPQAWGDEPSVGAAGTLGWQWQLAWEHQVSPVFTTPHVSANGPGYAALACGVLLKHADGPC